MTRQEWIGIVGVVFTAVAVVVAVLVYFGKRAERRNDERIEATLDAVARDAERRDERIEATLDTVVRDLKNLAVDVAFLAGRQAERDAAGAGS